MYPFHRPRGGSWLVAALAGVVTLAAAASSATAQDRYRTRGDDNRYAERYDDRGDRYARESRSAYTQNRSGDRYSDHHDRYQPSRSHYRSGYSDRYSPRYSSHSSHYSDRYSSRYRGSYGYSRPSVSYSVTSYGYHQPYYRPVYTAPVYYEPVYYEPVYIAPQPVYYRSYGGSVCAPVRYVPGARFSVNFRF